MITLSNETCKGASKEEIQWGKYSLKTKVNLLGEKVQLAQKRLKKKIKWWVGYDNFSSVPEQNCLPVGCRGTFEDVRPVSPIWMCLYLLSMKGYSGLSKSKQSYNPFSWECTNWLDGLLDTAEIFKANLESYSAVSIKMNLFWVFLENLNL